MTIIQFRRLVSPRERYVFILLVRKNERLWSQKGTLRKSNLYMCVCSSSIGFAGLGLVSYLFESWSTLTIVTSTVSLSLHIYRLLHFLLSIALSLQFVSVRFSTDLLPNIILGILLFFHPLNVCRYMFQSSHCVLAILLFLVPRTNFQILHQTASCKIVRHTLQSRTLT